MKWYNALFSFVGALIFFVVYYILATTILPVLPDATLWRRFDFVLPVFAYSLHLFDIVSVLFGFIIFTHGVLHLAILNEREHIATVHSFDSGEFGKIRHPVFGSFLILELGLFISIRSLYGVAILVVLTLVQVLVSYLEDHFVLKKRFEEKYDDYCATVKRRFFTPVMAVYYCLAVLLTSGGVYYMFSW